MKPAKAGLVCVAAVSTAQSTQPWRIEFAATQTKSACADYRKIEEIETREGEFSLCSCGFNRPLNSICLAGEETQIAIAQNGEWAFKR